MYAYTRIQVHIRLLVYVYICIYKKYVHKHAHRIAYIIYTYIYITILTYTYPHFSHGSLRLQHADCTWSVMGAEWLQRLQTRRPKLRPQRPQPSTWMFNKWLWLMI